MQRQVERFTPHRCCVVYGALPPETRRQQAQLFNSAGSGYSVLVASDAVGMGLNLNIARIIFYALHKFNGESKALIPSPMVPTPTHPPQPPACPLAPPNPPPHPPLFSSVPGEADSGACGS